MKQVCRWIKWGLLLNKRLLKKPSFLVVLLMVPCLVAAMLLAAQQDGNVLTIALYGNEEDTVSESIIESFLSSDSIVNYERAGSAAEAALLVEQGKADGAWIFAEDLSEAMNRAVEYKDLSDMVTMIQREDSMQMRLVRVKLYAAVFPEYLYVLYEDFMEETLQATDLGPEGLAEYFSAVQVNQELFVRRYMDEGETVQEGNYLLAPLRGMLAVWFVLAIMAAIMYYQQDEQEGLFDRVPGTARMGIAIGYQAIVALDGFVVVLLSLYLTGTFISWQRELVCLLLYAMGAVGFCNLLRVLCGKMERTGAVIPILMVALMIFCPVFLDLKALRPLQRIFPTFYYLSSVHSRLYRVEMLVFAVVTWLIGIVTEKIFMKYRK